MQVSEHVYTDELQFGVQTRAEQTLERVVYFHLVCGREAAQIDAGVAGRLDNLAALVRSSGRELAQIDRLILSHGHPDHIGGALAFRRATGCSVSAHRGDLQWIEDVKQQYSERPVPGFHHLVQGSVQVDYLLEDGERIDLGDDSQLHVIFTPGHSKGHLAFWHERDRVLIAGDSIPVPGQIPIYDDMLASLQSLTRLESIQGIEVLLSSWDTPKRGDEIPLALAQGKEVIRGMHRLVLSARDCLRSSDVTTVGREILPELGLPESALNPLFLRTVEAHLRAANSST
ncbi:MAG: MBL fold metallo-hydrolase [Chloroflexi bacterium]|nr:MBL fold metallo-hydrolase [Chloroflexota bacterium]